MSGYAFHPDAFADLDEIWEYIGRTTSTPPTESLQTSTQSSAPWPLHHTSDTDVLT
jgi:hypothetical protein